MSLLARLRNLRTLRAAPRTAPGESHHEIVRSVAIIMDGNARWARGRGLPVIAGHRAGTKAAHRTIQSCLDLGIESLCIFAFSTENWSRSREEVEAIMELFGETIERELPNLMRQRVRVRFVGRDDRAPEAVRRTMEAVEERTAANDRMQLWVAFDYGGRAELVAAARRLVEEGVDPRDIDENAIASRLYAPEMPEPDLLIRTSGELRLSNFLLWQVAYSELVFVETHWPDFGESDLRRALEEYASRRRRFGGR
jgi:undecaprenyl diphosphate synthase